MNVWITLSSHFPIFKMMVDTSQLRVVDIAQKLERKVESGKMSPEFLREHCRSVGVNFELHFDILWNTICNINFVSRKNDLYMIPHFNTILYLHHKVTYWWMFWFCLDFLLGKVHLVDNHFIPILQNFLITFCWTQTTTTVWWQTVSNNCMPILNTI